jgi:hypothetical protein
MLFLLFQVAYRRTVTTYRKSAVIEGDRLYLYCIEEMKIKTTELCWTV